MADWDADSPQLRANLDRLLNTIRTSATLRPAADIAAAKQWHREMLAGLTVPDPSWIGSFRGEQGLEDIEVHIRGQFGTPSEDVGAQLNRFASTLQQSVAALDALVPPADLPNQDQLVALLNVCAWTHAEWVRIHPFANGNGRIARLWVNWLAMRYNLPPFLHLRPRPDSGYADAAWKAMEGNWRASIPVLRQLFHQFVNTL